jgi:hypothetical protein
MLKQKEQVANLLLRLKIITFKIPPYSPKPRKLHFAHFHFQNLLHWVGQKYPQKFDLIG